MDGRSIRKEKVAFSNVQRCLNCYFVIRLLDNCRGKRWGRGGRRAGGGRGKGVGLEKKRTFNTRVTNTKYLI